MTLKSYGKLVAQKMLARRGFELRREPSLAHFLASHRIDLLLDVGANLGQFALHARNRGYTGKIWSYEPTTAAHATLAKAAAHDADWSVFRFALGDRPGEAAIRVAAASELSSFRSSSDIGRNFTDAINTVHTEMVDVRTIDQCVADVSANAIFLKIDTQGFEKEVLGGATETLKRCKGLLIELPLEHLYEGVWSFREAIDWLDDAGFVPAQFRSINVTKQDSASALEVDCIFRRKF
jgi:FkbM family methyltransferase